MFSQLSAPEVPLMLLSVALVQNISAQPQPVSSSTADILKTTRSASLQQLVNRSVRQTLETFAPKKLETNQIAVTLIDLTDPQKPGQAGYRGSEQIYPASVIKLFYLVAAHRWMEDGKLKDTEEFRRALRDMIVDSLNEATG